MRSQLGPQYDSFEESVLRRENVRALRTNAKKISVGDFQRISPYHMTKIPYNDDGFYLHDDVQMGGQACHQAGMFYMQEPSAMIPVDSVEIRPDWKVLDVCAAPGGKTCQISNRLSDEGLLVSNDVKFDRCRALIDNVERLGLTNTILTSDSVESLCSLFREFFDLALVDATCSGEGMFRKNRNIMAYWSEKKVRACAEIQKGLLDAVAPVVKGSGYIIYSTCTFSTEENEETVSRFLDAHPEYRLVPPAQRIIPYTSDGIGINDRYDFSLTRRFYPHTGPGEGQFVAVLRKTEGGAAGIAAEGKDKTGAADRQTVCSFLTDLGVDISPERIMVKGNKAWIMPKNAVRLKKHVLRNGVLLGELDSGGAITPSHSFFMAFGHEMENRIELPANSPFLDSFLRGDDLNRSAPDGWGAVTVENCAVGGFFARSGYLRNLYPGYLTNKDIFDQ